MPKKNYAITHVLSRQEVCRKTQARIKKKVRTSRRRSLMNENLETEMLNYLKRIKKTIFSPPNIMVSDRVIAEELGVKRLDVCKAGKKLHEDGKVGLFHEDNNSKMWYRYTDKV